MVQGCSGCRRHSLSSSPLCREVALELCGLTRSLLVLIGVRPSGGYAEDRLGLISGSSRFGEQLLIGIVEWSQNTWGNESIR